MNTLIGLLIPFAGTTLGAAMVFLLKDQISPRIQKLLLGFASGVMMAASVWSLLIPSIDIAERQEMTAWLPAAGGFLCGMAFLLLLDSIIPHLHVNSDEDEGLQSKLKRSTKLVLAVTLHNIPEGMAVGVVLAGAMAGDTGISLAGAMALSIGIAIQNFPEGAIISMPLKSDGNGKGKSFLYGTLSGVVEPVARHTDDTAYRPDAADTAVPAGIRRRSNDICRRRGADTRIAGRTPLQHSDHRSSRRFHPHDDTRRGTGITSLRIPTNTGAPLGKAAPCKLMSIVVQKLILQRGLRTLSHRRKPHNNHRIKHWQASRRELRSIPPCLPRREPTGQPRSTPPLRRSCRHGNRP